MAQKKIPMRMCVGCREMRPKKELIRIVRPPEGVVHADLTGKAAGRGAYLCRNPECLARAQKSKALERALEARIESDVFQRLGEEITRDG